MSNLEIIKKQSKILLDAINRTNNIEFAKKLYGLDYSSLTNTIVKINDDYNDFLLNNLLSFYFVNGKWHFQQEYMYYNEIVKNRYKGKIKGISIHISDNIILVDVVFCVNHGSINWKLPLQYLI